MHRYGTLDVAARAALAPLLKGLKAEAWTLKGVQVLDARTEIDTAPADALVPPALRPGIPAYGSLAVSRVPDSPAGPFQLAELRVGVRVGSIAGFFLIGAVCDSPAAAAALSEERGFPIRLGEIALEELYHQVTARVTVEGRTALELRLTERHPLPGTRLNLPSLITLAREGCQPLLLSTPTQIAYAQPDGGRHEILAFDGSLFGAGDHFRPVFPMSASFGTCELTLGSPDFTMDPEQPAQDTIAAVG
jgi:hypothetical protein